MAIREQPGILIIDPYPTAAKLFPLLFKPYGYSVCVVKTLDELSAAMLVMDVESVCLVVIDALLEGSVWAPDTLNILPEKLKPHVLAVSVWPQLLEEAQKTGFHFLDLWYKEDDWIPRVVRLLKEEQSASSLAAH